jgi:hypothetical protein
MGVHVEWDDPEKHTIIVWSFVGRWTWGEYDDALRAVNTMLEPVDHKVDFIYDVRHMSILPPDVVTRFKMYYLKKPEKSRLYLAVGVDKNLQLLWDTFSSLPYARHLRVRYFDTVEEARDHSENYREPPSA